MRPFAAVFPGQGAQHPGMGRSLFDAFPESRAVFREADDALGQALSRVCFEGTEDELSRTETTQPAILTVAVAALRAFEVRGARPSWGAGHSLGEYAAHVAAGTFSFGDAVRTVRLRGRYMQEAVPVGRGAMAAILGLDAERLARVCAEASEGEVVAPANFNGPGQIVIAGGAAAVARASERALAAGARKAVPLPVSAPFHCALMEPAATRLSEVLAAVEASDPSFPVYSNVDAEAVRTAGEARDTLVRQVASPVRWHEEIEAMCRAGVETFVELGPGKVLAGLIRRIAPQAKVLSVSDAEGVDAALTAVEVGA